MLRRAPLLPAALSIAVIAVPALADPARTTVTADVRLDFGKMVVVDSGSRRISASGMVTDSGVMPVSGGSTRPAQFTVAYDRGNENRQPLDITVEVVLSAPGTVASGGVTGKLSAFETDLPGYGTVVPGQVMRITFESCAQRICSRSFRVGARIDLTRRYGGGTLAMPLPIDATVVGID
ncbi:uncharacterized protein DUF4402 [Novosphingobium sp. PhB165]|uniref:DUF4402 domain-containing protein n=1 Tax=Novosphingobium sp. PhB165 TaxID=2485105 RepID=UPI0010F41C39|nr:DUF4402 domain-containing protein [Novosphingobium sp. PhB165]TCM19789.1 uncharacterized protein DUF4402 [Novosphingobium sp. PhB165]